MDLEMELDLEMEMEMEKVTTSMTVCGGIVVRI